VREHNEEMYGTTAAAHDKTLAELSVRYTGIWEMRHLGLVFGEHASSEVAPRHAGRQNMRVGNLGIQTNAIVDLIRRRERVLPPALVRREELRRALELGCQLPRHWREVERALVVQ